MLAMRVSRFCVWVVLDGSLLLVVGKSGVNEDGMTIMRDQAIVIKIHFDMLSYFSGRGGGYTTRSSKTTPKRVPPLFPKLHQKLPMYNKRKSQESQIGP